MKKLFVSLIALSFVIALAFSLAPNTKASTYHPSEVFSMQEVQDLNSSYSKGKAIFEGKGTCSVCHQLNGAGLPPAFPPLAKADYLLADKNRAIRQTMYGSKEPITVNGQTYPGGVMTITNLSDEEVKDVVNYILNSWGNDGGTVTLEEVKAQRK
ncbi:MAG: cytochrome c [Bacteroidales bacterium]|nr:cytochrome c [Bacteroidales bacterium]